MMSWSRSYSSSVSWCRCWCCRRLSRCGSMCYSYSWSWSWCRCWCWCWSCSSLCWCVIIMCSLRISCMSIGSNWSTTGVNFFQFQAFARFGSCSHGCDMHIRMGRYFISIRVRCGMTSSSVSSSWCMRISFFSYRFFCCFLDGLFLFRRRLSGRLCRCICGYLGVLNRFRIRLFRLDCRL